MPFKIHNHQQALYITFAAVELAMEVWRLSSLGLSRCKLKRSWVQTGGLLLSSTRNDGKASHVQVVTSLGENSIGIHQGNLRGGFFGSANPSSWLYGGVPIQRGTLNTATGTYTRGSTTINNFVKTNKVTVRRWNFGGWKK